MSRSRIGGYLLATGNFTTWERDTVQCCHCGMHYIVEPGSGKQRSWCIKCAKPTCGKPACLRCEPTEVKLLRQEEFDRKYTSLMLRAVNTVVSVLTLKRVTLAEQVRYQRFMHNLWGG